MSFANKISAIGLSILLVFLLISCVASYQKPLTLEELVKFPTVVAFAKERYADAGMSFNHHKWQQRESADRTIVSFIVASNPSIIASTKKAFYEDMRGFCEAHGGTFKDLSAENSQKFSNLVQKFSYQEESRYFECGPVGRGTKSNDWTKFNPATCRKLYETNADMQKVRAEYGTPANFHCVDKTGVRFMITAGSERYNTSIGPGINLIIRVNEATKGIITPVSGKIDME